jgi:hypothetical protein
MTTTNGDSRYRHCACGKWLVKVTVAPSEGIDVEVHTRIDSLNWAGHFAGDMLTITRLTGRCSYCHHPVEYRDIVRNARGYQLVFEGFRDWPKRDEERGAYLERILRRNTRSTNPRIDPNCERQTRGGRNGA